MFVKSLQQLRLTIIKAENLMKYGKDIDCNSYIKVYLESAGGGKASSRSQTEVIRGNKNPVYNRLIILKDIAVEDLKNKSLRLRVCNKVGSGMSIIKASQATLQRWSCPLYVSLQFVIPISVISHSPKSRSSKL